jgi:hypothetical protein
MMSSPKFADELRSAQKTDAPMQDRGAKAVRFNQFP